MNKFTIDRKFWVRGGDSYSVLFRPEDKKKCCLGFYLEACGIPLEEMTRIGNPSSVSPRQNVPDWLLNPYSLIRARDISDDCSELIKINDDPNLSESFREESVRVKFQKQGIEVIFTG